MLNNLKKDEQKEELVNLALYDKNIKKYIFGINILTDELLKIIDVNGIIDEFTEKRFYKNAKIVSLEDVNKDSIIIIASSGKIFTVKKKLSKMGFQNVLHYVDILRFSNKLIRDLPFNENFKFAYNMNYKNFEFVYSLLEDKISKEIYVKLINFRYSYDLDYLKGFKNNEEKQYFEPFLNLHKEIFVDGGGFDGFTSKLFIEKCPNYKMIYFFEPDINNLNTAKSLLSNYKNINFYNIGLYDRTGKLRFKVNGSTSTIDNKGNIQIKVDKLDNIIKKEVTYVKLDIEGSEEKAIIGMKNTIKEYHPKLAIAVYHSPNSFWQIPRIVLDIRNDYKIYLRHYTESIYETIMYFVPK